MRISDWSSDVCSSDLIFVKPFSAGLRTNLVITTDKRVYHIELASRATGAMAALSWTYPQDDLVALRREQDAAASAVPIDRQSVGEGKSVSVRVDHGGRRILKKKNK